MTRALRLLSFAWQRAGRVTQGRVILSLQVKTHAGRVTSIRVTLALRLVYLISQRVGRVTLVVADWSWGYPILERLH